MLQKLLPLYRYFPAALIVLFLSFFGWFAFRYIPIVDDFLFLSFMKEKSISEAAFVLYDNFNGRLASHFFLCTVFEIFNAHTGLFFIYHFTLLAAWIFALAKFLQHYLQTFRGIGLSFKRALFYSAFTTAFFFFFFFEGRVEAWFWVSATGVHLTSLILALAGFAILFDREKAAVKNLLSLVIFFLTGGFSESYALMYIVLLGVTGWYILKKKPANVSLLNLIFPLSGLVAALLINISSPGIHARLGWLPQFDILQSLKNTLHSLALPLLRWKHLPFKIALLVCLILYAKYKTGNWFRPGKIFWENSLLLLAIITVSFALPCYLLSDVVPDRAASLAYLLGVLFLFDQVIFRQEKISQA